MMCAPSPNQRVTSIRSNAVEVIANQQTAIMMMEGRKPLRPVARGNASMPPPIHVPATSRIAEMIVKTDDCLVGCILSL